ncbi:MAG: hypothetical protein M5U34_27000 [Chloroflexi bacterium]|nr:hypothetical protein [Chloroflexota bacterium]
MADANGNDTQLRWNAGGSNIEFVADALENATRLSYDSYNNLTQTVDARGITTTLYYENPAFPTFRTRTVDVLGHTQRYTPTVAGIDGTVGGLLKAEQDASGLVTSYQYNDQGQIIETVRAAGTSAAVITSYGYDTLGQLITTTQAAAGESLTTLNVYNSNGRLKRRLKTGRAVIRRRGSQTATLRRGYVIPMRVPAMAMMRRDVRFRRRIRWGRQAFPL